jgi:hypothetical protein
MGVALTISRIYIPPFIKQKKLGELFVITADAFQSPPPSTKGLSFKECLTQYALFTRENAEKSFRSGDQSEVKKRLYRNALGLGQKIKGDFHIDTPEETMLMAKIIYKILGIKFQGDRQGKVTIPQCFFSNYYSGSVCEIISGLDQGLLAGLSGGSRLVFSQRITGGNTCCKAQLYPERNSM